MDDCLATKDTELRGNWHPHVMIVYELNLETSCNIYLMVGGVVPKIGNLSRESTLLEFLQ